MRYITLVLILIWSIKVAAQDKVVLTEISELAWQNRVLLIFSDNSVNDLRKLSILKKELSDRHIVWFVIEGQGVISNYPGILSDDFSTQVKQKYGQQSPAVVLIGKDGGVKQKADTLDLEGIFQLIDTMPMRQQEMQSKQ